MPVTTIKATAAMYGNSNYNAYTEAAQKHLYVGYTGGSKFNYRSCLKFPSLKTIAAIGSNSITINSIQLFCYRNDQGSTTVTIGPSTSTAWNASLAGSASATWAASSTWKSITLNANNAPSALAAIRDYNGAWYIHMRGGTNQNFIRLDSIGNTHVPYIQVNWDYAEQTVTFNDGTSDVTGIVCDGTNSVTINIDSARYSTDASYAVSYAIGDQSGNITSGTIPKSGDVTSVTWTPGIELLNSITTAEAGTVTITLTAYNSSGGVYRTEKAYLYLTVPENIRMITPTQAVAINDGYGHYALTNRSQIGISPVLDGTGLYGATPGTVTATIELSSGGTQILSWNSDEIAEEITDAGWIAGHYDANGNFFTPETWASSQNTYRPLTSRIIPVVDGVDLRLSVTYSLSHSSVWAGVARFDADGNWIARTAIYSSGETDSIDVTYTPQTGDAYIRVIFRSYNDYTCQLSYDGMWSGVMKYYNAQSYTGNIGISIVANDTRGRQADMTGYSPSSVTALAYTQPVINSFDVDRVAEQYDSEDDVYTYVQADDGKYGWANLEIELASLSPSGTEEQVLNYTLEVMNVSDNVSAGSKTGTLAYTASGAKLKVSLVDDYDKIFPTALGTPPLFDTAKAYEFTLVISDATGISATAYSQIVPGRANMHLSGSKYGVAFGMFSNGTPPEQSPGPLLESAYPAVFYNGIDVRGEEWTDLGAASGVSRPTSDMGMKVGPEDAPYVCCYRVENGHHVFAYARAAFQFTDGTVKQLNLNSIPKQYRPRGYMVRWGAGSGSYTQVRAQIRPDGYIYVESVVNDAGKYTSVSVTWTELWFEWFV